MRSHSVDRALPWPHWIGALPSDESRPEFAPPSSPTHPFRRGEFLRTMALTGEMDPLEIGTAMAAIALYGAPADEQEAEPASASAIVQGLLDQEGVIVGGGIEITIDGAIVVTPECCAGLERWREWIGFADGGAEPWAGHSPDPYIERLASGMIALGYSSQKAIHVAPEALRAALARVEDEVAAFTVALQAWANSLVPELAAALGEKLAGDLALRPPR